MESNQASTKKVRKRELTGTKFDKLVYYRDEKGNLQFTFDMSLLDKYNEEQDAKLETLPSIKFEDLVAHLLSKKQYNQISAPRELGYLQPSEDPDFEQEKVIIVSFSRSGNTLTRAYLQRITGTITGSVGNLGHVLSRDLFLGGMWGECLTDDRIWFIKSHYPGATNCPEYQAHKAIVCVRNPIDTIVSLFQFLITGFHHIAIEPEEFKKYREIWSAFIRQECTVWYDFYKFWLNSKIPIHIIRYEDILSDPFTTFSGAMKLLLNVKSIEGRAIQKYVELVSKEKAPQIYEMKSEKKLRCEHFNKYLQEDLDFVYQNCKDLLEMFGYDYLFTGAQEADTSRKLLDEFNLQRIEQAIQLEKQGEIITITINQDSQNLRVGTATRKPRMNNELIDGVSNVIKTVDKNNLKLASSESQSEEKHPEKQEGATNQMKQNDGVVGI